MGVHNQALNISRNDLCRAERPKTAPSNRESNERRKSTCQRNRSSRPYSLLGLPGETRNHIYELALTTPTRNLYCWRRRACFKDYDHHSFRMTQCDEPGSAYFDFNQLKFTCRQLYAETAYLEVKWNTIIFTLSPLDKDQTAPGLGFLFITSVYTQRSVQWLTTVILDHNKVIGRKIPEPATTIAKLAEVCRRNPHITVKYVLHVNGGLPCAHPWYISYLMPSYVFFVLALRDVRVAPRVPLHDYEEDEAVRWRANFSATDLEALNLRFFLADWDKQALGSWFHLAPQFRYGEMVRTWIQNGF